MQRRTGLEHCGVSGLDGVEGRGRVLKAGRTPACLNEAWLQWRKSGLARIFLDWDRAGNTLQPALRRSPNSMTCTHPSQYASSMRQILDSFDWSPVVKLAEALAKAWA